MRKIVTKKYEAYQRMRNVERYNAQMINDLVERERKLRKTGYKDEAAEMKRRIEKERRNFAELQQRTEATYNEAYKEAFEIAAVRCLVYVMAYITYGYAFSLKCLLNERCADDAGEVEYAKRVSDSCKALFEMAEEFGVIGGRDNESFNAIEECVSERAEPYVRQIMGEITLGAGGREVKIRELLEKYGVSSNVRR